VPGKKLVCPSPNPPNVDLFVDLDLRLETVHHFTCGLSKILGAAQEWGYVPDNLARKTRLPRRQHRAECPRKAAAAFSIVLLGLIGGLPSRECKIVGGYQS
jgi:hypothetical protein